MCDFDALDCVRLQRQLKESQLTALTLRKVEMSTETLVMFLKDAAQSQLRSVSLHNLKTGQDYYQIRDALLSFKGRKMKRLYMDFTAQAKDIDTLVAKKMIAEDVKQHLRVNQFRI
jgi:hypothetical protein